MLTKICKKCKIDKPLTDFTPNKGSRLGVLGTCKVCRKIELNTPENRTKLQERRKRQYNTDPEFRKKAILASNKRRKFLYNNSPDARAKLLWESAKRRAKLSNNIFTLSLDKIRKAIWNGRCERTDIFFVLAVHETLHKHPYSPSIDQIVASGGYTDENVQIVCWAYNRGKDEMTDEQYHEYLRLAVKGLH